MRRKEVILVVVITLIFALNFPYISAQNIIGVSPANINFIDVLRGGYAERYITISYDADSYAKVKVKTRGDAAEFFEFDEEVFNVSKNNPHRLLVKILPPRDIPNGNYTGYIVLSIEGEGIQGSEGAITGRVLSELEVVVSISITDQEYLSCTSDEFSVTSPEKGDSIIFYANTNNYGNVRLRPIYDVLIWDADQINIIKNFSFSGNEILPTKSGKTEYKIDSDDFEIGQYWVDIASRDCYSSATLTFDILEEGSLKANGILTGILSPSGVEVDDTIPIYVLFKNIGEKELDSQFKGRISLDNKIIQVLESEEQEVNVGELTNFTFYFTPRKEGKYIVSGRVFYDKKRTFESSGVIMVNSKKGKYMDYFFYIAYLILFLGIIFILYKARDQRRRYKELIKGL